MPFVYHTTMQQHFIDISITIATITESKSTTGKKNTQRLIHFFKLQARVRRGGRVGKPVALSGKKKKTESRDRAWNWHPRPRFPIQCLRTSFPDSFASSAGKRNISSRSMGIVWQSKWFSDFPTISVKTRQEEYLWRFLQPKNFLWKGLFDLIFSPEKPFFHTNGKHHCHLSGESPEN